MDGSLSREARKAYVLTAEDGHLKDRSSGGVQVRLVKMGGRMVRRARRLVFQLAKVAVPRDVLQRVLERIGRSCPAPA